MNASEPLAFFITWTIYGTHLQGDEQGWRKWGKGHQVPRPELVEWRQERLKHPIIVLNREQRDVVEQESRRLCEYRGWRIWAFNARSTHCHIVVTARKRSGKIARDQIKANCTRMLREQWSIFHDRPVWTVAGDWQKITDEVDLDTVASTSKTRRIGRIVIDDILLGDRTLTRSG